MFFKCMYVAQMHVDTDLYSSITAWSEKMHMDDQRA